MRPDLLFAYGTLMRGFPLHHLLAGRAGRVGTGQVRARLLDLGAYPAAVPATYGVVYGELYRVSDPALWITLDSAEGPQYHREQVAVRNSSGRNVNAFIYWYTGPLDRGIPIPGGDYRAHAPARSIHT
ncbi:MAG TPA: gamma-glutamylcyclotransferase family protein [Methylomirabilota bacterium]|nr:gamma-glutamylcyclotransferase family protein [Methylomirabilota bacterium]